MDTRPLGKDGPEVSIISFGAWPIGGGMGPVANDTAVATVRAALDAGMTFIDTAQMYRTSESIIGEAIRGRRDEVFLATKVSVGHTPREIDDALRDSLRALGTDYVDLYQLHGPRPRPIDQTMEHLVRLRKAGKFKNIGISNFSAEQTTEALQYGPIHSSQPIFNMLFRDAADEIVPCCRENGIGVIAHSVLGKGLLTGRYTPGQPFPDDDDRKGRAHFDDEAFAPIFQVTEKLKEWAVDHGRDMVQLAIAWTLAQPGITAAIVGAKSPEQVNHNAKAADWRLTDSDLEEIDAIQGDLRLHASGVV
jgi:aryl-alcohol dehydrogenase-like predicted oxidoreductase